MKEYVPDSIKKVLDAPLIDDLCKWATGVPDANYQNFRLMPYEENGITAQLVIHTLYNSGYSEKHVVNSAKPVDASISVFIDKYSCNLSLSSINASPSDNTALLKEWSEEDYRVWAM